MLVDAFDVHLKTQASRLPPQMQLEVSLCLEALRLEIKACWLLGTAGIPAGSQRGLVLITLRWMVGFGGMSCLERALGSV